MSWLIFSTCRKVGQGNKEVIQVAHGDFDALFQELKWTFLLNSMMLIIYLGVLIKRKLSLLLNQWYDNYRYLCRVFQPLWNICNVSVFEIVRQSHVWQCSFACDIPYLLTRLCVPTRGSNAHHWVTSKTWNPNDCNKYDLKFRRTKGPYDAG